jgi:predicted transcriptional regulator
MNKWVAGPAPEETALVSNMNPDIEYTASSLANICGTTHQKVSATLRNIERSGLIVRYKKAGSHRFVYKTNQLVIDLGE